MQASTSALKRGASMLAEEQRSAAQAVRREAEAQVRRELDSTLSAQSIEHAAAMGRERERGAAALRALEERHAAEMHEASERAVELRCDLEMARQGAQVLKADIEAREREHQLQLLQERARHEEALAVARAGHKAEAAKVEVAMAESDCLIAELRRAERDAHRQKVLAEEALAETGSGALEVIGLRAEARELRERNEVLTRDLTDLRNDHDQTCASYAIALAIANKMRRLKLERQRTDLVDRHVAEVARLTAETRAREERTRLEHA